MSAMFLTLVNLFLCLAWGWGAFQRLRRTHKGIVNRVRIIYSGMMVASVASGFRFQLFGEYAGFADITVSVTMVAFIILGSERWKYGAPMDLMKNYRTLL